MENMENNNVVWNPRETVTNHLSQQIVANGVELQEEVLNKVASFLAERKVLKITKIKDLGDFHPTAAEEHKPVKTLLVNNMLVYVFSSVTTVSQTKDAYHNVLNFRDLCEDEYSYEDFLEENNMEHQEENTTTYSVRSERIGDLYFGNLKRKSQIDEELNKINQVLEVIKPIVDENFIQLADNE